jgi:hypothetical protein
METKDRTRGFVNQRFLDMISADKKKMVTKLRSDELPYTTGIRLWVKMKIGKIYAQDIREI